jgi:Pyridoxamine 5'-phosphate oxidase
MELKEYFENTKGTGILATAGSDGQVDAAVYARPSIMEDGSLAFIMRDRLTYHNLQSNSHATYMFIEHGPGYKGKRLYLTKLREEKDTELLESLRKRMYIDARDESKYLVIFNVTKELPLIGDGQAA